MQQQQKSLQLIDYHVNISTTQILHLRSCPDMEIAKMIVVFIHLLLCLMLICVIILQTGKNSGLSAFTGANETYLAKNKAKSRDARLALATKWVAGVFVILTVILNLI